MSKMATYALLALVVYLVVRSNKNSFVDEN